MKRIVLDTNVLVAGLRSRRGASFKLLSLIGEAPFEICLSVPLLFEYEDVLNRAALKVPKSAVEDVLDYLCSVAHLQEIHFLWRPLLKDPKDDMVLELAVASGAAEIVTFNIADFQSVDQFGVQAVTPAKFLVELGVLS